MKKLKINTLDNILNKEFNIISRASRGEDIDIDLLRHYEKRRLEFYKRFDERYKGVRYEEKTQS